ncbi:hypothetical protein POM88_025568 [Heracleum sosnowskyi]|uniref:Uncharacterized protein n=1 Tax=Heracleum sosnowskyi TaxID=360622 RepID=A0AAD8I5H5_9APIA|nr:hypothetical protein POM88_025568 [Heracleum sosnowskyi]
MEDKNSDEELGELTEVINLISSNSAEEISEYFQTLNDEDYCDGDVNYANNQNKDEQQVEIDKFMSLASTCYSDREALLSSIRNLAATLGYITVIKKSIRDRYVRVGCDRGGEYRANRLPVKKTGY